MATVVGSSSKQRQSLFFLPTATAYCRLSKRQSYLTLELLETSVNNGQENFYHITKSFRITDGKFKIYPISEAAAFLNNLSFRKGLVWGGAAFISLAACSIILIFLA